MISRTYPKHVRRLWAQISARIDAVAIKYWSTTFFRPVRKL